MHESRRWMVGAGAAIALLVAAAPTAQMPRLVLDKVRIIDGAGAAPIEDGRMGRKRGVTRNCRSSAARPH